jgi:hypothetical protein
MGEAGPEFDAACATQKAGKKIKHMMGKTTTGRRIIIKIPRSNTIKTARLKG